MEERARASTVDRHRKKFLLVLVVAGATLGLGLGEVVARVARPEWAPPRGERVAFWTYDQALGEYGPPTNRADSSAARRRYGLRLSTCVTSPLAPAVKTTITSSPNTPRTTCSR